MPEDRNDFHINRLRQQLISGCSDPTGPMPDRNVVEEGVERFLSQADDEQNIPVSLRDEIRQVLNAVYGSGDLPAIPTGEFATEAVIIGDGSRPVFFISDDALVGAAPSASGPFVDIAWEKQAEIENTALAVGRVENDLKSPPRGVDKWYEGTAFLVGDGLAMTNRHVIERMVTNPTSQYGPFLLKAEYWLNFDAQRNGGGNRRFAIDRVLFAGSEPIGRGGDISRLDLALLKLGSAETPGASTPTPIRLTKRPLSVYEKVAVVGFPAPPKVYGGDGAPPTNYELEEVMRLVFDERFGYKRAATGQVEATPGQLIDDSKSWTISHDASTLSGNSGSPIIALGQTGGNASALHFGGLARSANYAHAFSQLENTLSGHGVTLIT